MSTLLVHHTTSHTYSFSRIFLHLLVIHYFVSEILSHNILITTSSYTHTRWQYPWLQVSVDTTCYQIIFTLTGHSLFCFRDIISPFPRNYPFVHHILPQISTFTHFFSPFPHLHFMFTTSLQHSLSPENISHQVLITTCLDTSSHYSITSHNSFITTLLSP